MSCVYQTFSSCEIETVIQSPSREVNREFTWFLLVALTNINSLSPYIFFRLINLMCSEKSSLGTDFAKRNVAKLSS